MNVEVLVPDLGEFDEVDVVEVLVAAGDHVDKDESLITLESDKASMDIPAPQAGVVSELRVAVGDKVSQAAVIVVLDVEQVESTDRADDAGGDAADEDASAIKAADEPAEQPVEAKSAPAASTAAVSPLGDFDAEVVVIGSGPGGYAAAFRAADLGLHVTLVERYASLGGVCLNVGCIPSKALLHVARVISEVAEMNDKGVSFGSPAVDLERLRGWQQSVVERLTRGLAQMADKRGVEVVQGSARFTGSHHLHIDGVDGERELSFAQAVVACGSRSVALPGLPMEDPRLMDSTAALQLEEVPSRLLVIGGGIIGLEMATVYEALGSKVTIVELLDRLMPGCDADLVKPLQRRLKRRYEAIRLSTKVTGVTAAEDGLHVSMEGSKGSSEEIFDRVLVAVGRRANGQLVGALEAGVDVDERGVISVDAQQRTNVSHIFAIGDVTGEPMLAHRATHQGKVAAEVMAGLDSGFDTELIPAVAYTDPEVAWVGLTEEAAAETGRAVEVGVFPWLASGRSLAMGRTEGFTKLIFDADTRRLLGGGIVGQNAGDLIAEVALAIEMGADGEDLSLTVHPHPTLSETVAFAAEVFEGTITDLYLGSRR